MTSAPDRQTDLDDVRYDLMDRRRFLRLTGSMAALVPLLSLPCFAKGKRVQRPVGPMAPVAARHALWYDTPAPESNLLREGLPIGNGRLGALVGGDAASTVLYLTDASMWLGKRDVVLGDDGQFDYSTEHFGSLVMLAKLYLSLDGHEAAHVTDYRRELDLDQGYLRVSYRKDGIAYSWDIFASHPDDVIAIHLSQGGGGTFSGSVALQGMHGDTPRAERLHGATPTAAVQFEGTLENDLRYATNVMAVAASGSVTTDARGLQFANCSTLTVIVCGGTNYSPDLAKNYMDASLDPLKLSIQKTRTAARQAPAVLLHTHVADYRSLFDAMRVNLGTSTKAQREMDTWTRLQARAVAGSPADPELEATYLQYGRYLTIAGSRDSLADRPARPVDRQQLIAVDGRLSQRHQHPDELLAARSRRAAFLLRSIHPLLPQPGGCVDCRHPRTLQRSAQRLPQQHRKDRWLDRRHIHQYLWRWRLALAPGRERLAVQQPVAALSVQPGSRLPRPHLSLAEGRLRILGVAPVDGEREGPRHRSDARCADRRCGLVARARADRRQRQHVLAGVGMGSLRELSPGQRLARARTPVTPRR